VLWRFGHFWSRIAAVVAAQIAGGSAGGTGTGRSALQIIFGFEPRSDLLDHFATFGVVF
jgi:hypothetical protein